MALTLQTKLHRFPPLVCYLLAREGPRGNVRHMGATMIAIRCRELGLTGFTDADVLSLSWKMTWDDEAIKTMLAFTEACGIPLNNRMLLQRQYWYLTKKSRTKFSYLMLEGKKYRNHFFPLIESYRTFIINRHVKNQSIS